MVSCYTVYKYWEDKGITETGEISDVGGIPVVQEPYLPSCWACGKPVNKKAVLDWDKYDKDIKELWTDKKVNSVLQRCHILARQFGGSDEPENLFLLCEDCHVESPDTKNRNAFFRWVYRRRKETAYGVDWKRFMRDMESEIKDRGYDVMSFLQALDPKEGFDIADAALQRCGLHGMNFSQSSVAICVIDEMEHRILEKRKQELSQCV